MANPSVPSMQELLEAGVHFGHKVSRGNPQMKCYIYGARDGVHIIDLAKSEDMLKAAVNYAYELGKDGKVLMIVGTKKQARELVENLAKEVNTPYVSVKWLGGLLTNWEEVRKNFTRLNNLRKDRETGNLKRYTKREQLLISRKVDKFMMELGGVADMQTLPHALFIVDAVTDNTAVKEALRMNIPIVGFCDTNANPLWFEHPVPANDDGIKSLNLICETIIRAYGEGKKQAVVIKDQADKAKADAEAAAAVAVDGAIAEEAAVLEQEIEKKIVEESKGRVE